MNKLKSLFLKLILRPKFIGQIAAAIASAIAAYLITMLPGAPEVVNSLVAALLGLEEGAAITKEGLTVFLMPLIMMAVNAVAQELVIGDNNKALEELKKRGAYDGDLDGWVGPNAQDGIRSLDRYEP